MYKMKFFFIAITSTLIAFSSLSQQPKSLKSKSVITTKNNNPKVVVGIVIDQMRWDFLQRFKPLFKTNGGFNRMMNNGFNCNNTMIPYTPTVTACGHTCVYTGSVPNIHGIVGNNWWDKTLNKEVYCTEDKSVNGVGTLKDEVGKMSPKNMLVTTICDELKLATNFKSKVIGISFKDRGAILPAGHSANAAYWFDRINGNFITSTHYLNKLPKWIDDFNNKKLVDSFYKLGWDIALPKSTYLNYCTDDIKEYEYKVFGKDEKGFPYHNLKQFINKDYSKIISTPYGNTITMELAKAAIINEKLGQNNVTDFLAISFSSPDYIGHYFGPNSWELLDCYIRLDEDLGKYFDFLDQQLGAGNYLSFLTADHAVAHIPAFMQEHKLPGNVFDDNAFLKSINKEFKTMYNSENLLVSIHNYQITFNHPKIDSAKLNYQELVDFVLNKLEKEDAVMNAFELKDLNKIPLNKTVREMLNNGYFNNRSGDLQFILKPGFIEGKKIGTTHGLWNPYDTHIPLIWYGWGIKKGNSFNEVYMTDIAATLAALLKIQMPSGCIGKVIQEVIK